MKNLTFIKKYFILTGKFKYNGSTNENGVFTHYFYRKVLDIANDMKSVKRNEGLKELIS